MPTGAGGVTIRTASPADAGRWVALFEAVADEGKWLGAETPFDRPARRARFEELLGTPDALALVAEAGGDLVGLLTARLSRGVVDLGMLVDDRWRRRGIGSRLLERCMDWATDAGAHKVILEVWPHNEAAISLYTRFGFVEEGRRRRHYRRRNGELWDVVQMGLVLDRQSPGSPWP